jgi:hypothetical protein
MTMKILLTEVSVDPGPDTLVVFPGGTDAKLTTLRGALVSRAFVARAHARDVGKAVDEAIIGPGETEEECWDAVDDMLHDLSSVARSLLGYRDGSPVGVQAVNDFVTSLDLSEASEMVPTLAVGDPVVITAPSDRNLVNARGRVGAIVGGRVLVDLDPGDRDRLERSCGQEMESGTVSVPRRWVEAGATQ